MANKLNHTNGKITGPWRTPINIDSEDKTNIHNEEDAKKLGFRGGLVAGSIHMEMFLPELLEAFGEAWLERGCLSMYFMNATLDGEEVRAVVGEPDGDPEGAQVAVYGERPDGTELGQGTASLGESDKPSALHDRELSPFPAGDLKILSGVKVGDEFPVIETRVTPEYHAERMGVITEKIPEYSDASLRGGLAASPVPFVDCLAASARAYLASKNEHPVVGLFGAIEIRNVNGPLLIDTPYQGGGKILALGQSPKTEYVWYDAWADDPQGNRTAEMRMMIRYVKASSVLYNETATTHP